MTLSNLAVPAAVHSDLHKRYFAAQADWPWSESAAAQPLRLAAEDRRAAMDWMAELERPDAESAHPDLLVQTLLGDLLRRALRRHGEDTLSGCPQWLRESIEIFDEPRHYGSGVLGLARIAGVGREHLSRSIRRYLDCTAGELINRLRLAWVRKQLACTNHPIQSIALDAGFGNLAHFHRLFRQVTGETPGSYRRRLARDIV